MSDTPLVEHEGRCPICGVGLPVFVRHPNYVCRSCALRTVSASGRPVRFNNESISGGLVATFADNGETHDAVRCWIDGVECEAREAKFGGIVIQPVERDGPPSAGS